MTTKKFDWNAAPKAEVKLWHCVAASVKSLMADDLGLEPEDIKPEQRFTEELEMDPVDFYSVQFRVKMVFFDDRDFSEEKFAEVTDVRGLINFVMTHRPTV